MPLAASYLRPNDYQVLKFSPARLNVNDIAKTLAIKTAYWNQGAERVKSRYMDALNLNVSNPQNQQIIKDYISKSEGMIKNLSSQDLGNPDVQEEGINIFKPLFNDKGIMFDDALTKHYGKVRNDYYSLLKSDPSKASEVNLAYALEDQQKFVNDPDRNSAESYYNNRKDYHPYYDATSEINNVMKQCKADAFTGEAPIAGTGYARSTIDKNLTQDKVKMCFEAGLSQQARKQFNISGYMTFKNNKDALANEYMGMNSTSIKRLQKAIADDAVTEATLLNKQKAKTASPDELAQLADIQNTKKNYQSQLDNYNEINGRLAKKDYSDIDKDFENIAGSVFTDIKTSGFGRAFSFNDFTKKIVDDPVGMLYIRQQFETAQQEDQQAHEKDLKEMEITGKAMAAKLAATGKVGLIATPTGVTVDDTLAPLDDKNAVPEGTNQFRAFQDDVLRNENDIKDRNAFIAKRLKTDDVFTSVVGNAVNHETGLKYSQILEDIIAGKRDINDFPAIGDYIKNNEFKEPLYGDWLTTNMALHTKKNILNEYTKTIENSIPEELRDGSKDERLKTVAPTIVTIDGKQHSITAQDMQAALEGKNNPAGLRIENRSQPISLGPTGTVQIDRSTNDSVPIFSINGREISGADLPLPMRAIAGMFGGSANSDKKEHGKLANLYSVVNEFDNDRIYKLTQLRKEKYGDNGWKDMNFYNVNPDDKSANVVGITSKLASLFKNEELKGSPQVMSTNYQGGVKLYLPGYDNTIDKLKEAVGGVATTRSGQAPDITRVGTSDTYIVQGLSNFDYSRELGLDPTTFELGMNMKAIARNLTDGDSKTVTVPLIKNGQSKNYTAEVIQTPNGPSYRFKEPGTGTILYNEADAFQLMHRIQTLQNRLK